MPESRLEVCLDRVGELAPVVREHSAQSEREAQLAPAIVEAFHRSGLFRIMLPVEMGGGGLTLPESLRVFEAAARLDGSAGWNLSPP